MRLQITKAHGVPRGGSRGDHGGQKIPSFRIIQGKPKEWCSGIKMPYNASFLEFSIISILNEI